MGWEGMKNDDEAMKFKLLRKVEIITRQGGIKGGLLHYEEMNFQNAPHQVAYWKWRWRYQWSMMTTIQGRFLCIAPLKDKWG